MTQQKESWLLQFLIRVNHGFSHLIEAYRYDRPTSTGTINQLDRAIDGLLYILSALLLISMAGVVTYSIFMRYTFSRAPLWSEAVPMVFFIWMTFLALVVATRRGDNIRVTYFIEKLSPFNRLGLELFMHALVILMMAVIFWFSFYVIQLQMRGTMLSTGWNLAVVWIPLPIGMALMALYQFKRIHWSIRTYRDAVSADSDR